MPYNFSFGTMQGDDTSIEAPTSDSPFRIGVLADFSGRDNRAAAGSAQEIAARRLLRIHRDDLDSVMAKMGVQLALPVGDDGDTAELSFASLDDFHPDQIHERVDKIADADDSDDKATLMNTLLHHPHFQALEAAWRGVDWLLGRAAKGGAVEVELVDVSLTELAGDLMRSENLADSALHQLLIEKGVRGPKGGPWSVFVGNYVFDLTGAHAELLGRIAKIVGQANAPFLTTVEPAVLDPSFRLSDDAAPAWQALRQLPEAALLGLCVPRFLLRLPYGESTQSIDKFSFEEMSVPPDRGQYLWGNPALGCAALLAQGFHKGGWGAKPGASLDLENLPIHVYSLDGEEEVTLAEAWLMRPQIEQLVKHGLMLFLCVRGKGALQLFRFQSLAQPAKGQAACELQGHWGQASGVAPVRSSGAPAPKVGLVAQATAPLSPMASLEAAAKAAAPTPRVAPVPAAKAPAPPAAPAAQAPAVEKPAPARTEPEAPAAEEEMDPDLAALLKQLE